MSNEHAGYRRISIRSRRLGEVDSPVDEESMTFPSLANLDWGRVEMRIIGSDLTCFVLPAPDQRLGRNDLYMNIAKMFSLRSTCTRGHVGCVAVKDNHIVAAGYNGAPTGMPHCLEVGCGGMQRVNKATFPEPDLWIEEFPNGCTRAVHAEMNMVAFAACHGIALDECAVYATHGPCLPCAQALVSSGIANLVYETPYRLPEGLQLVDQANIGIVKYGDE